MIGFVTMSCSTRLQLTLISSLSSTVHEGHTPITQHQGEPVHFASRLPCIDQLLVSRFTTQLWLITATKAKHGTLSCRRTFTALIPTPPSSPPSTNPTILSPHLPPTSRLFFTFPDAGEICNSQTRILDSTQYLTLV